MARIGRPPKPESVYRAKRLRFSMVEDQMLKIIDSLEDERDKKLAREILEKLKPVV